MKNMKLAIIGLVLMMGIGLGQANAQNVLDGIYQPEHTLERRVIPYSPLREADIMWLKRAGRRVIYAKRKPSVVLPREACS